MYTHTSADADRRHPTDINDFFGEIKDIHTRLGSLYSAVIDVDKVNLEAYRDLLIMDNKFVAETQLSPWLWHQRRWTRRLSLRPRQRLRRKIHHPLNRLFLRGDYTPRPQATEKSELFGPPKCALLGHRPTNHDAGEPICGALFRGGLPELLPDPPLFISA
jgi:hypothetical protein